MGLALKVVRPSKEYRRVRRGIFNGKEACRQKSKLLDWAISLHCINRYRMRTPGSPPMFCSSRTHNPVGTFKASRLLAVRLLVPQNGVVRDSYYPTVGALVDYDNICVVDCKRPVRR